MSHPLVPVILCGGPGARLWPLSTPDEPKPLLQLAGEHTMLQDTVLRLRSLALPVTPPLIVCNERHAAAGAAQMRALGATIGAFILEAIGRNSAPATTVAAMLARDLTGGDDPLLLVLPADHMIEVPAAFAAAVAAAVLPAAAGYLTTFGVVPTAAATAYGYIRRGTDRDGWSEVAEFVEKPDATTARAYVDSGQYLWNSGMFMFSASVWLREVATFAPDMLAACERALTASERTDGFVRLGEPFNACPADSIDYAVMEKTRRAAVVPLAAGWRDVGSWSSLHDALPKDADGNVVRGDVVLDSCRDTYVRSRHRLVAAIGLEGIMIVETEDAVLVVAREHAEAVRRVADLVDWRRR